MRAPANKVIVQFGEWRRSVPTTIILPAKYTPQPVEGRVIAVGPKADPALKPGLDVIVSKLAGEYFDHNGERYCSIEDQYIYGIDESKN